MGEGIDVSGRVEMERGRVEMGRSGRGRVDLLMSA